MTKLPGVKIDRITYQIVKSRTPDEMAADGHLNTAKAMKQNNIALDLILQRPKGKKLYHVVLYRSGVFSTATIL